MKHEWNQIWSIKVKTIKELKQGTSDQVIRANWNIISSELDVSIRND